MAQRLQRLAAQFAADRAAEVDPARHGASRLATARFDQLMIMHLRLRRIPQAARLAAVDRQRSLRLGIAAEAARIRIILQRAAEIARAADRHMTVLHGNDPAGQRRSGVLRRVELLAVRAAGQINRIRSAAEADGILLRACGTLDLYNDRSGNAAQRAVLLCKPGIGKRDCRLAAAERRARDRAVTQEGMALGREHIGAAPVLRGLCQLVEGGRRSGRSRKIAIDGVERLLRLRNGKLTPGAEIGQAPDRLRLLLQGPARKGIVLRIRCRSPDGKRQDLDIVDIALNPGLHDTVRHDKVQHSWRLGREVDRDRAVRAQGRDAEQVALLRHNSGPLRGDRYAVGIVAAGRDGRDRHALLDDRSGRFRGVRRHGRGEALQQAPDGADLLHGVDLAVTGIGVLRRDDDGEGCMLPHGFLQRCGGLGGIAAQNGGRAVPVAVAGLHGADRLRDRAALQQLVEKFLFKAVIADKGNGLAVAVDHADARVHKWALEAVRGHAEADRHPDKAAVCGLFHMVGNDRTVDLIVAHAVDAASAVDGVAVGIVLGRQALAALQAEVGRRRFGGVVLIVAGIVRGAVAVKQDNAAGLDRVGNGVDRRGLRLIIVERALGLRGDALALFVVLARE